MKRWQSTYKDNHLRLKKVHIGFIFFYILLFILWLYSTVNFGYAYASLNELVIVGLPTFLPLIILHTVLAYGAQQKIELSRKISELIFAIMLLGFPIGTLLSMFYFLPLTVWKQKK